MHYVYILQTLDSEHWYVGLTDNVERRLAEHNAGKSPHTAKYRPWKLGTLVAFYERDRAELFERYL